jgi:hypothetical protein
MARGLTDYLNDWDLPKQDGDARNNASGADAEGDSWENNFSVPYTQKSPPSPEWGVKGDDGGYGHSDDVVNVDLSKRDPCWDVKADDIARGYTLPKSDGEGGVLESRQVDGSHPQSIPDTNKWDRTHPYAKEHSEHTGTYDGQGQPKSTSNPGKQSIGSRQNLG